jgi:5'-nucleotidase
MCVHKYIMSFVNTVTGGNHFGPALDSKFEGPKKILYFDLDGTLADFQSALDLETPETLEEYQGKYDNIPGLFSRMLPMKGAVEAFETLSKLYDCYFLSTAPWENKSAWGDKLEWVRHYFPESGRKRLIITHHKNLNRGFALIDDRMHANGAEDFEGIKIAFGSSKFPDWASVVSFLLLKT